MAYNMSATQQKSTNFTLIRNVLEIGKNLGRVAHIA